jgi:hypothetical protein
VARQRIERLHPDDPEAGYRQAMDELALRLRTRVATATPDTPEATAAELAEKLADARRRLAHWSRPASELEVCGTCRYPGHERGMAMVQIRRAEGLLGQLAGTG